MELFEHLRQLLDEEGLSQALLAKHLGLSKPTVSPWVNRTGVCDESYLARIVADELTKLPVDDKPRVLAGLLLRRLRERVGDKNLEHQPAAQVLAGKAVDLLFRTLPRQSAAKTSGRTLMDFPEAFYPLTIVTGDKRETSEARINPGDFGTASASPAETRWVSALQLAPGVEFLTDKVVILENFEQLRERFGKTNLLVVGSPGSNHLARRLHYAPPDSQWRRGVPIFRFNLPKFVLHEIETFLTSLHSLNPKQLVGRQGDPGTERQVKQWLSFLFAGGIFCPAGGYEVRAQYSQRNRDFGLVTLARNPFAESDEFVTILAAGFHMMGTAHAIRLLSNTDNFEEHPLGGVVRVNIDLDKGFASRFDDSEAEWDTPDESTYGLEDLRERLVEFSKEPSPFAQDIKGDEFAECLELVGAL